MERGHFLTNTMDKPLWKLNFEFLHFLQTSFFLRRKHSFLSRIWQNRPFCLIFSKKKVKNGLTHRFGPKMDLFPACFFLGNKGQENVFYDILEQKKNAFLGYKKKTKFTNSKNWHFSKGVNQWFWSKNGHFSNLFFLGNIGKENVFYDILKRKNGFLGYRNKKFKMSK